MIRRFELIRPARTERLREDLFGETQREEATPSEFAALCDAEVEEMRTRTRTETMYLVVGLLLPVWGKLRHKPVAEEAAVVCPPQVARAAMVKRRSYGSHQEYGCSGSCQKRRKPPESCRPWPLQGGSDGECRRSARDGCFGHKGVPVNLLVHRPSILRQIERMTLATFLRKLYGS
ncbi:hypothetical protein [Rhizorhabdus argentea]|uniref:hypothetical protein n=1 Tax=Rhizorhabdus argentea TaxID=1387174 RepID=UPI0030EB2F1D